MTAVYLLAGVLVVLGVGLVVLYNGLVRLRNQVENSWAQIDVQLKRRHDLIPNLVEVVKGYMKHEREVLENVTKARSAAVAATGVQATATAENLLTGALGQLRVVMEKYPDLKASQNVLALQEEMFPSNLVAGIFGFKEAEFFEIDDPAARAVPQTEF